MISVKHKNTFLGPNPYADLPVIVGEVEFDEHDLLLISEKIKIVSGYSSPWFLFEIDPDNQSNKIILMSFIAQWSKAALIEVSGSIDYSEFTTEENCNLIIVEFHHPNLAFNAIELAIYLIENASNVDSDKFSDLMTKFWNLCRNLHPDFQIKFLMDYAKSKNIPVFRYLENTRYWQFGWGCKSKIFFESTPIDDSAIGREISSNKNLTKQVLRSLGLPIVDHVLIDQIDDLPKAVDTLGYPLVVKPLDRGRSVGVSVNVIDYPSLKLGFEIARKESRSKIIIEEFIPGDVYRVIVVRGKFWKVIKRAVPFVIGDGKATISELLEEKNNLIDQALRPGSVIGKVPLDDDLIETLNRQNLTLSNIPSEGYKINLQSIPLLSTGAQYYDVTNQINIETVKACELISSTFSIDSCGIDFITENISTSCHTTGAFIEVNSTPGLNVPFMAGIDRKVIGKAILGNNCSDLPILFILADKQYHYELSLLFDKSDSLGWLCGDKSGVGQATLKSRYKNIDSNLKDIVKNKKVSKLILIAELKDIENHGLPFNLSKISILIDHQKIPGVWARLIQKHSEKTLLKKNIEISEIINNFLAV